MSISNLDINKLFSFSFILMRILSGFEVLKCTNECQRFAQKQNYIVPVIFLFFSHFFLPFLFCLQNSVPAYKRRLRACKHCRVLHYPMPYARYPPDPSEQGIQIFLEKCVAISFWDSIKTSMHLCISLLCLLVWIFNSFILTCLF